MKLEVKNIKKSFGDKEVLHGVSFMAKSGMALGLLGRNGAGKTTSIRIIMDVFHATGGEVLLDGKKFSQSKMSIGYLPEERGLYPKKSVIEQMVYLARIKGMPKQEATTSAKKWLARLGLEEYEKKLLETLSKGNQQKVQFASTLVTNPDIVILDEPFSGLDPVNSQVLKDVVKELINDNKIVIFSSHQMNYVEEFCEDIVIIDRGEIVLDGNLTEIKKEYGRNQLVLSSTSLDLIQLEKLCIDSMSHLFTVTGKTKEELIIKKNEDVTRNDILSALIKENVEIEHFETYKPSLNDIFVERVGD